VAVITVFAENDCNDIFINSDGEFALEEDIGAVGLRVTQRLRLFRSESFMDTTAGIPYYTNILGKNIKLDLVSSILETEIYKQLYVTTVEDVFISQDSETRELSFSATVTAFNEETQVFVNG